MAIDERLLLPVPNDLPPHLAALIPTLGRILRAVRRCQLREGETLGLVGDGAMADLARLVAESSEVATTSVADDGPSGLTSILHFSSADGSLGTSLRALAHMGRVVTMHAEGSDLMRIPDYYRQMIIKETAIVGSGRPTQKDLADAVALAYGKASDPRLMSAAGRLPITSVS